MKMKRIGGKWNYARQEYEPYSVPEDWRVILLSIDMTERINCTSCGKEAVYGDCYTSMEIHTTRIGLGYPVCSECYDKEWERKIKYKGEY